MLEVFYWKPCLVFKRLLCQKQYIFQCASQQESVHKQSGNESNLTKIQYALKQQSFEFKKTQHSPCFWAQQNSVVVKVSTTKKKICMSTIVCTLELKVVFEKRNFADLKVKDFLNKNTKFKASCFFQFCETSDREKSSPPTYHAAKDSQVHARVIHQ